MYAHLIGICGSGMRSLAELLLDLGWRVSGSDAAPNEHNARVLRARGVSIRPGHAAEHVTAPDLVVYSPAVPPSNPERAAARQAGIPECSYPEMLGRLLSGHISAAIAGTHGKTTTTAMLAWILQHSGNAPSLVCGGELLNTGSGGWGRGAETGPIVVEACEYRGSFWNLSPTHAAILDIEPDHFDCYPDLNAARDAYAAFAARLPAGSLLLCRAGRPAIREAASRTAARVETFGVDVAADWTARNIRFRPGQTLFQIARHGADWAECRLQVPGHHNVLNALAAAALSTAFGVPPEAVRRALSDFQGVRRRFERLGSWRGAQLVDDYAHHPTAVAATLAAARGEYPGRRICCVFQPHQLSRTENLLSEFAASLRGADKALVLPVYAARETETREALALSRKLVQYARAAGVCAQWLPSLDRLLPTLETDARPGDVIVLMGAGDIERVRDEFARRVPRHHAS